MTYSQLLKWSVKTFKECWALYFLPISILWSLVRTGQMPNLTKYLHKKDDINIDF